MSQNLSSAAVGIGPLRVNSKFLSSFSKRLNVYLACFDYSKTAQEVDVLWHGYKHNYCVGITNVSNWPYRTEQFVQEKK